VRALAERGRNRLSGGFRAAVFGANDGLVSNLSLVLGVGASGVSTHVILLTGIAGVLAGALSMGAGEFISVHSQRELLAASTPNPQVGHAIANLNVNANELALVFRSRGMTEQQAQTSAARLLWGMHTHTGALTAGAAADEHEALGTGMGAALSSFCFFASGAIVPVIPYLFGMAGIGAVVLAAVLVGVALVGTGAIVGLLSGSSPVGRALRQLAIGYGAAAVTYLLGLLFGVSAG
jgi:VIT1/CCC1 family predicted Fe2+/Mn2+ transporter